jgi:uncharacterized protein
MRKLVVVLVVGLLLTTTTYSQPYNPVISRDRHVTIVAVTQLPNGSYVGVTAELYVRITCPGSGHVYVETLPLSELDLQASTRVAALVASRVAGIDFRACDYYASITSDSPIVGGPSASGVTAVAFAAALLNLPLRSDVVMTGMIMPDGSVGPVGGLKAKLEAAAGIGAKKFLVPYGQTHDVEYVTVTERRGSVVIYRTEQVVVDLVDYGRRLGVEVVPVANVFEALEVFSGGVYRKPVTSEVVALVEGMRSGLDPIFKDWVSSIKYEVSNYLSAGDSIRSTALKSLSRSEAAYVNNLLNNIESRINDLITTAKGFEGRGLLYAAASTYFQALIYVKWRYYILKSIVDSSYLRSTTYDINSTIHKLIDEVHNSVSRNISLGDVSVLANVLERVYDAYIYLNNSLSSQGLEQTTYYLALADARAYTARLWLKLLGKGSEPSKYISVNDIKGLVLTIELLTRNIYAYILAFSSRVSIPSGILNEAYMRYSLMNRLGNDLDKFSVGLSTLGYMYLTLVTMFINNYNDSVKALNNTILSTLEFLNTSIPVDTVVYMELANAYSSDPQYQTYMLARLSMLLSTYLNLEYVGKQPPMTQTETTVTTITKTVVITETVTTTERVNTTQPYISNYRDDLTTTLISICVIIILALALLITKTPPGQTTKHTTT